MILGQRFLNRFKCLFFLFGIFSIVALVPSSGYADLTFDDFYLKHSAIILVIEPETGRIVDANEAASLFYGYSRGEFQTMGIQDINALSKEEVAKERNLAKEENRNFFIFRHKLKSGDIKTVEVYSNPYEYQGKTVLISIIHDISIQREIQDDLWHYQSSLESMVDVQTGQLKKTYALNTLFLSIGILILIALVIALVIVIRKHKEARKIVEKERQKLDEIIWSTNVGTWEWYVDTQTIVINEQFANLIGYTLAELEPTTFETWRNNTHPDDVKIAEELIRNIFSRKENHYEVEFRMIHKNGHYVWILSKGNVVEWNEDGRPLRMVGTHSDISQKKDLDIELQKAKKVSEEANLAKSEFLATISYGLRKPIIGIRSVLDQMRENKKILEEGSEYLNDLDAYSRSLKSLLEDMLVLTKIETGQLELDVDAWEPAKIVQNIVSLFRPNALAKGINISTNAGQYLNYWCKTDDIRLRQILANLVDNAIKFTKEGGQVDVYMQINLAEENDRLIIEVSDNGIGISKDKQKYILNRFVQEDLSASRKLVGSGLGLAIAHELTVIMGGHLSLKSKLGKGTTLTLSLPVKWTEKIPAQ